MKKFKLMKEKGYFQSLRETKSVKETDDGAVEISGYASTKDKDRGGDVVEPKAFASALERYMTNPIVLLQHKADKPIGIVEEADIDENGLFIKAKISQNTDGVIDLIKNGVLRAFSIGYSIKDYETDVRELADGTYDMTNIIKDLELYEISVVSVPMNPYALSKSVEDLLEVEETEEETEVEEEQVEENDDEKSDETVDTDSQNDEESDEGTNVQTEEKVDESETEETTESEEIVEEKKEEEIEEHPNEEAETEETCEEEVEKTDSEETVEEVVESKVVDDSCMEEDTINEINEINGADENSEISDEEEIDEESENDVETTSNEDEVVETHNDEIVETKSIETESQKQFDFESKFAQLSKSFDERLAEKDEKIKSLESKVEKMTQLFAESVETIDRMTTAVKNTPVNSGLQYKRPLKKGGYYDIASIIKSL